jgi:hypothetical protein
MCNENKNLPISLPFVYTFNKDENHFEILSHSSLRTQTDGIVYFGIAIVPRKTVTALPLRRILLLLRTSTIMEPVRSLAIKALNMFLFNLL